MRVGDIFITGTTIKSLFDMLLTCSTVNPAFFHHGSIHSSVYKDWHLLEALRQLLGFKLVLELSWKI